MSRRRLWHVSSSLNRESIAEHGLDWRRMTITTGVAASPGFSGPYAPELEAVFLCQWPHDVDFFVGFGQHPLVDVWEVDTAGLALEPGPEGWLVCRQAVGPERVRLVHADVTPGQRDLVEDA